MPLFKMHLALDIFHSRTWSSRTWSNQTPRFLGQPPRVSRQFGAKGNLLSLAQSFDQLQSHVHNVAEQANWLIPLVILAYRNKHSGTLSTSRPSFRRFAPYLVRHKEAPDSTRLRGSPSRTAEDARHPMASTSLARAIIIISRIRCLRPGNTGATNLRVQLHERLAACATHHLAAYTHPLVLAPPACPWSARVASGSRTNPLLAAHPRYQYLSTSHEPLRLPKLLWAALRSVSEQCLRICGPVVSGQHHDNRAVPKSSLSLGTLDSHVDVPLRPMANIRREYPDTTHPPRVACVVLYYRAMYTIKPAHENWCKSPQMQTADHACDVGKIFMTFIDELFMATSPRSSGRKSLFSYIQTSVGTDSSLAAAIADNPSVPERRRLIWAMQLQDALGRSEGDYNGQHHRLSFKLLFVLSYASVRDRDMNTGIVPTFFHLVHLRVVS
ncbi:hypothetical protein EVG20_g3517 [Dentipellis fragilis]|uniref:Uncharacterized protein n=1 Tax=Dentipellis fragilis TaxID=205917 RepID=A0A4Y9Z3W4_9AGAM|nr:hypothetical protein EVG20_g3517 [Dentipellis fragilis]